MTRKLYLPKDFRRFQSQLFEPIKYVHCTCICHFYLFSLGFLHPSLSFSLPFISLLQVQANPDTLQSMLH